MTASGVVDHLCALIRIPSVSALSNRPVIDYAAAVFGASQWHFRRLSYLDAKGIEKQNLLAAPAHQSLDRVDVDLAIVCHTDTVPFAAEWLEAQQPFERNGSLHGCGACDVKGFLACLLEAVRETASCAKPEQVRIILTADEETGCIGATRLLAVLPIKARKMIVGEPTSLRPARAGKGYALAEFVILGREAHSALPAHGVSAIYGAARFISAIEMYAEELSVQQNPLFDPAYTTINVGTIQGGTAKNIIAGQCRFLVEWRPIAGQPPDRVYEKLLRFADELALTHPGFRYSAKLLRQQLGFETGKTAELVRYTEQFFGNSATSIAFGSEASVFASVAEEIIVFGPGDMQTAHSDRESVPMDELHGAVRFLRKLLTADLS